MLDAEFNEGNKFSGIKQAIEQAQEQLLPEVIFPVRIVVNQKLAQYLINQYGYIITTNNAGLPVNKKGITKIRFIN